MRLWLSSNPQSAPGGRLVELLPCVRACGGWAPFPASSLDAVPPLADRWAGCCARVQEAAPPLKVSHLRNRFSQGQGKSRGHGVKGNQDMGRTSTLSEALQERPQHAEPLNSRPKIRAPHITRAQEGAPPLEEDGGSSEEEEEEEGEEEEGPGGGGGPREPDRPKSEVGVRQGGGRLQVYRNAFMYRSGNKYSDLKVSDGPFT
jgi:hypothetical protein